MDIQELKQNLLDGKLNHFYVFTGDELALQDIYIDKIKEISKMDLCRVDSLSSIFTKLTAKTLIKNVPCIYVIRNDEEYLKAEKSWDKFLKAKSFRGNVVILLYSNIKKTSNFVKQHEAVLTQFDFINSSLLTNRLMAVTGMPQTYCQDIVKLCGGNYGRIKNELYKLAVLASIHNWTWETVYLEAKKCNMIHEEVGDIIFDFTNAVVERNIQKAYRLWPKMKYTGDGPLRVLSVLYNSFRQILMVQSTPPDQQTEAVLGMTKGQIYVTQQKCNIYNIYEIVGIVKLIRYIEKSVKTGIIEESFAMEYLMGEIW